MNKLFYRTKPNGFLMNDSDLKVESAFYPPYVEDGGLDIGNNDPLIKGAIASKDIDSVPCLFIYQGLDVDDNQIWAQVGGGVDSEPDISLWNGDPIDENKYVTHPIDGIEYLFRSKEDGNTDEPILPTESGGEIIPWIEEGGPVTAWSESTTYSIGDVVTNPYYAQNWAYKSLVAGNIAHDPFDEDIENPEFWEWLGYYEGLFDSDKYYTDMQVATDISGIAWKSTIFNNNYAFGDTATSWRNSNEVQATGIPAWANPTAYIKSDYVTREVNESGTLYTYVYQAKQNNTGQAPTGGEFDSYWRFVGVYRGEHNPATVYGNYNVVYETIESVTNVYISNKPNNTSPLIETVIENKWQVIGAPAGEGSAGDPTTGTLLSSDEPLVINWSTAVVPGDEDGRTYLEKHGPLEKVSVQTAMPDPANDGEVTIFPNWRFDEATKNILTIDNQGQKLYYVIGFGADGSSGGGGGTGDLTNANFVDGEEPFGDIDGTNVAYTLANSPVSGSVRIYLNGLRQRSGAGNDYTITGSTITMATPPAIGNILIADYRK